MSWNNRVVWSEGMFLRPQHFQQHDRYLETLVDGRCRSLLAGGWGFSELKLDDALLTQGKLAIASARGVLPDGTPFNIPADDPAPAPLNVEESLRDGIVYLGLPLKRVGTRDTVEEGEALGGARYVSQVQEVRDDNAAFESRAPVALGSQAFRLLTERDGLGEYAAVGVARVREKRADQALSLDEDYLPPVLDIAAAPPLASFAKELLGLLHQRGEALAGRVVASSAGGASEIADFLLLQLVNRAEALTGHLSRVRPLHPQELYRELVALAGEFCTFTASQRRPEEYPVYNHDDLAASFAPVMLALRQALATVIDAKAIAIPIVEKAYGVHVAMLSDRSLIDNASFVLVVRADVPGESLRGHFPQQAKVGSVEHIRDLVNLQLPGIGLLPMPVAPRQIPYHAGSTRLRNTIAHPAPASLRAQLLGYLRQFEEKARQAGVAPDEVMLARYVLCTALDEAVLSTPWGSTSDWGKQSLLITLHNEAWGGEKVFQLLEHCLQNPHQRLHLLELLYLCTSLGFEGRYRVMHDGRSQLEALRERTAAVIRSTRGEYEHELSPHWRGLSVMRDRLSQYLPPWVGIAIGLALLLALLFGLRMKLAADAEPVFKRIHAIGEIPVQAIDRPAVQPRVIERPRLARFLADDIKAQRVAVEDAVDRSVVTIRGDELFASASASVRDEFQPLLLRIADALRKVKGQVLVTGHSDNRPIATLRYPSNWKLSQARAQEVADLLGATTGDAGRFTAEGRSDTEPVASNASAEGRARNRRVEITVFAEGAQ